MSVLTLSYSINNYSDEEKQWIRNVIRRNAKLQHAENIRRGQFKLKSYKWKAKRRGMFSCPKCYHSWRIFAGNGIRCAVCKSRVCSECIMSYNEEMCKFCRSCYEEMLELGKSGDWFRFKLSPQQLLDSDLNKLEQVLSGETETQSHIENETTEEKAYKEAIMKFVLELQSLQDCHNLEGNSMNQTNARYTTHKQEHPVECGKVHEVSRLNLVERGATGVPTADYTSRSYWENVNMLAVALQRWSTALEEEMEEESEISNLLSSISMVQFSWGESEVDESMVDAAPAQTVKSKKSIVSEKAGIVSKTPVDDEITILSNSNTTPTSQEITESSVTQHHLQVEIS